MNLRHNCWAKIIKKNKIINALARKGLVFNLLTNACSYILFSVMNIISSTEKSEWVTYEVIMLMKWLGWDDRNKSHTHTS